MTADTRSWLQGFAASFDGDGVTNLIASVALIASIASIGVAIYVYLRSEDRERRIEKSTAYLDLEVHSSEAFRYQAEKAADMEPFRREKRPKRMPRKSHVGWQTTTHFYFQCLNLFEVCANFRRHGIIKPAVFASWVAWFHDILNDWYFQDIWASELRTNYTRDVRRIFDVGVVIFARESDPELRKKEFYDAVAYLMGDCQVIKSWLTDMDEAPTWPPEGPRQYKSRRKSAWRELRRKLEGRRVIDYPTDPWPPSELKAKILRR